MRSVLNQHPTIPSCSDIKLGTCSSLLSNLGIKDAFPIIHKWMVDRMPQPRKIKPYKAQSSTGTMPLYYPPPLPTPLHLGRC